jgi:hypothetical protein
MPTFVYVYPFSHLRAVVVGVRVFLVSEKAKHEAEGVGKVMDH